MTTTEKVLVGVTVAALGVAAYAIVDRLAGDDDRPPIIVKGGSLYFENTTTRRPGKVWTETNSTKKEWRLVHGKGKKVAFYQVYFVGGTGACAPIETDVVVVKSNTKQFTVKIVDGRPTVSSDHEMDVDSDETRLIADPEGQLSSVTIGSAVCTAPTAAYLEALK